MKNITTYSNLQFSKFFEFELPDSFEVLKEKIVGDVKVLLVKIK